MHTRDLVLCVTINLNLSNLNEKQPGQQDL